MSADGDVPRCGVKDCPQRPTHDVHFTESWYVMCTEHAQQYAEQGPSKGVLAVWESTQPQSGDRP